ncbi:murein L,D-transpeptidase YcbB/YkuD [Bradyrhizobium sp. LM2.7]
MASIPPTIRCRISPPLRRPIALADAELKLTASMFDYARQAQSGRMHWSQVSADILYPEHPVDPNDVLAKVTTATDASAALDSYNPPQKLYKELKAKLAQLRGQTDGPVIEIADGPAMKYTPARGKKQAEIVVEDPRVPQLRAKLGIAENASDTRYDATVAEAVRKFQDGAEIKPTGILDDKTVKALNSPKRDKQIDVVLVNMERWRWLPRDLGVPALGDAYVILNIPDYTLKVMQRGQQVWTTRVVTGKPGQHATPLLTETMKYITVNPTWNVPPSIVYNEYLPALQQDPTVLQRMGLKLEQNRDGSVHISQPPGEANALGRIRFNFPNKFLVYQHDTPDKNLFARDERAFSHWLHACTESGSVRVRSTQHRHAEREVHAGARAQHVRQERDRPEIPDADPGQHHLPDRVRGRWRQAAIPQGRLWPRRDHDQHPEERPRQGSRERRSSLPAELFAPGDDAAVRRGDRQQWRRLVRSELLRAAVRGADPAAGSDWPPSAAAAGVHPLRPLDRCF